MEFETRAIHVGQDPDPLTGSVNVPIYQTSTYVQDGVDGKRGGHDYARSINPTRTALERCLASLERAEHGLAFASGMSAIAAILELVLPGQLVMAVNDVYGGTYRLFSKVLAPRGYRFTYADLTTPVGSRAHRDRATRHGLDRDADESAAEGARHPRDRRRRPRRRRAAGRRQHVREPVPAAAARARR